jgi:hypothetical protein
MREDEKEKEERKRERERERKGEVSQTPSLMLFLSYLQSFSVLLRNLSLPSLSLEQ